MRLRFISYLFSVRGDVFTRSQAVLKQRTHESSLVAWIGTNPGSELAQVGISLAVSLRLRLTLS